MWRVRRSLFVRHLGRLSLRKFNTEVSHGTFGPHFGRTRRHGRKSLFRGMPVTVGMIVGQIGAGQTIEELLLDYPYLERDDVLQALQYAASLAEEREVALASA